MNFPGPRRCGFGPRATGAKNRIFREVLYAPRFRPISEIDRRPGRGGYNYAVAGGAHSGAPVTDHHYTLLLSSYFAQD